MLWTLTIGKPWWTPISRAYVLHTCRLVVEQGQGHVINMGSVAANCIPEGLFTGSESVCPAIHA